MFFADYHTHSSFSSDSDTPMEDNIRQAIALGLSEIAVTDHIDLDYPDPDYPFWFDYEPYRAEVERLREKYRGKIIIRLGVEMGLQRHVYDQIRQMIADNEYDFIIGSSHCVDRCDLCMPDFFVGKTKEEAYERYFEDVLYHVEHCPVFQVYGHIDFISRYGGYADPTLTYDQYAPVLDRILRGLIDQGKGLEVNTSGFRYGLNRTHPQFDILKRYYDLGGRIVTVGSDAHRPEDIASHFEQAHTLLLAAGFQEVTRFCKQQPLTGEKG